MAFMEEQGTSNVPRTKIQGKKQLVDVKKLWVRSTTVRVSELEFLEEQGTSNVRSSKVQEKNSCYA